MRGLIGVASVLLASGCGRWHFDEQGSARDASDANDANDAMLGPCTQWGPFAAPVLLPELGAPGDDWAPTVTADELEVYFYSGRPPATGGFDIFAARRSSLDATFSTPIDVTEVSSTGFDHAPFISEDGLTMIVTSDRSGPSFDLHIATRANRSSLFSTPTLLAGPNTGGTEEDPWLSPDGLRLYFGSDRLTAGEIFVSSRATTSDAFGAGVHIAEIGSTAVDMRFTLSHDELEGFLSSARGGDYDIYRTTRADLASPFSTPVPVPELNTANDEKNLSLAPSGERIYFNYNNVQATGDAEIWSATRPCLAH